jgi:hypothetical protein
MLGVRMMINGKIVDNYSELKIEISSETDLYLILECKIDEGVFEQVKKQQSLNFHFASLLAILVKQFYLISKFPEQYAAVLYLNKSGLHILSMI